MSIGTLISIIHITYNLAHRTHTDGADGCTHRRTELMGVAFSDHTKAVVFVREKPVRAGVPTEPSSLQHMHALTAAHYTFQSRAEDTTIGNIHILITLIAI